MTAEIFFKDESPVCYMLLEMIVCTQRTPASATELVQTISRECSHKVESPGWWGRLQ